MKRLRVAVLDPGHFHAALSLREVAADEMAGAGLDELWSLGLAALSADPLPVGAARLEDAALRQVDRRGRVAGDRLLEDSRSLVCRRLKRIREAGAARKTVPRAGRYRGQSADERGPPARDLTAYFRRRRC